MLVLSRKPDESVIVRHNGETLIVTLVNVRGDKAKIGFSGPKSFDIRRDDAKKDATVQVQQIGNSKSSDPSRVSAGA